MQKNQSHHLSAEVQARDEFPQLDVKEHLMKLPAHLKKIPALVSIMEDADHIDVKSVVGECALREFVAGMFSYYPGWVKQLYRIRWGFVRLLGMRQEGIPQAMHLEPADIPMQAGEKVAFFTVTTAVPEEYWVAEASESHLTAYLGVVMEPTMNGNWFHVLTIVHYHRWTGPVYFNVIRPFHHLVVGKMAQAGANAGLAVPKIGES